MTSVTLIIPCFNEEEAIGELIHRLDPIVRRLSWRNGYAIEVLVVDDGSEDATADVVERFTETRLWLRMIRHDRNRNLGRAIETGVLASTSDWIAMLDADGTFPPEKLDALLERLEDGFDIAIGSAYHPDGDSSDVKFFRLLLSRGLSRVYRLLTGENVYSFSGIFRAYRRSVFENIRFHYDGFAAVSDILLQAIESGCRVVEVPVTLTSRECGQSKMRTLNEIRSHLRILWRVTCIRFRKWKAGSRLHSARKPERMIGSRNSLPLSQANFRDRSRVD